ncbi:hypothetical protein VTN77DRAFT_7190 [Rasamsonia byssochlamydoides]|uniref:uncharacterized protein n=1 Tax=Rasamsonia byssochlamydoides TaxID=89139 RepID=UPI0037432AFB
MISAFDGFYLTPCEKRRDCAKSLQKVKSSLSPQDSTQLRYQKYRRSQAYSSVRSVKETSCQAVRLGQQLLSQDGIFSTTLEVPTWTADEISTLLERDTSSGDGRRPRFGKVNIVGRFRRRVVVPQLHVKPSRDSPRARLIHLAFDCLYKKQRHQREHH